jgi:hypothetical protein
MRERKISKERQHEGVGALVYYPCEPGNDAPTPYELRAYQFVLSEDEKQHANRDTEKRKSFSLVRKVHWFRVNRRTKLFNVLSFYPRYFVSQSKKTKGPMGVPAMVLAGTHHSVTNKIIFVFR